MVEVQMFFDGLFATIGHLSGDFVNSATGFVSGLGSSIRDVLAGISLSK